MVWGAGLDLRRASRCEQTGARSLPPCPRDAQSDPRTETGAHSLHYSDDTSKQRQGPGRRTRRAFSGAFPGTRLALPNQRHTQYIYPQARVVPASAAPEPSGFSLGYSGVDGVDCPDSAEKRKKSY